MGFLSSYKIERSFFIYCGIHTIIIVGYGLIKYLKNNYYSFIAKEDKCELNKKA